MVSVMTATNYCRVKNCYVLIWNHNSQLNIKYVVLKIYILTEVAKQLWKRVFYDNKFEVSYFKMYEPEKRYLSMVLFMF